VSPAAEVRLSYRFHSPFRVGAAGPRHGLDLTVDQDEPLPTSHLKGLFRATARDLLGVPGTLVDAVFGSARWPCPWLWSPVTPTAPWDHTTRHRVSLDPDTHTARADRIVHGERTWAPGATSTILWWGQPGRAAPTDDEVLVLRAAAAGTRHLGGWRRRGLGHVTIAVDPPLTDDDVARLAALTGARAEAPA
jgi:hypothetical protein